MSKQLYKYYPPSTGINHVLKKGTINWSSPSEFNDPFDNSFILHLEEPSEEVLDKFMAGYLELDLTSFVGDTVVGDSVITGEEFQAAFETLKDSMTSEEREGLKKSLVEGIERGNRHWPVFQEEFANEMEKTAVFCMSETHDNLLMWAHYAQNHSGLVIAFASNNPDSPFARAKPVIYTRDVPIVKYHDLLEGVSDLRKATERLTAKFTLTKSNDWSYEREWRVATAGGGGIRPFFEEDIDAVYLVCKMISEDKEKAVQVIREKYPAARICLASKSSTKFALEFSEL